MTVLKIQDIRARANQEPAIRLNKYDAADILDELAESQDEAFEEEASSYSIFLSHSELDADLVLGTKLTLEDHGYTVCVDWCKEVITKEIAATLRNHMDCCKILLYITTASRNDSKWLPWKCAYMDGKKGRVAILPLSDAKIDSFMGSEFLGLYPYVMGYQDSNGREQLWLHESLSTSCTLNAWLNGLEPTMKLK